MERKINGLLHIFKLIYIYIYMQHAYIHTSKHEITNPTHPQKKKYQYKYIYTLLIINKKKNHSSIIKIYFYIYKKNVFAWIKILVKLNI